MGIIENIKSAARKANEYYEKAQEVVRRVNLPVPESLINMGLSRLDKSDFDGVDEFHLVKVAIRDGYMEVVADISHKSVRSNICVELEVVEFRVDFAEQGAGELVLRQRRAAEITGNGWWSRLTLLFAKSLLSVIANTSIEQWALGKVNGIRIDGQDYAFDLNVLGLREKLRDGIVRKMDGVNPLARKALEVAAGAYGIVGAVCREGSLELEIARNDGADSVTPQTGVPPSQGC